MWNEPERNERRGPEAIELPHAAAETALPELRPTGHAEVDAALMRLGELADRPTGGHAELYDDVHQRLQEVLAQLDRQR